MHVRILSPVLHFLYEGHSHRLSDIENAMDEIYFLCPASLLNEPYLPVSLADGAGRTHGAAKTATVAQTGKMSVSPGRFTMAWN